MKSRIDAEARIGEEGMEDHDNNSNWLDGNNSLNNDEDLTAVKML